MGPGERPGHYQAFQHFISHAPSDAEPVWTHLRAVVPQRTGVLILDTSGRFGVAWAPAGHVKSAKCRVNR